MPVLFGSDFRLVVPERSVKLESLTLVDDNEEEGEKQKAIGSDKVCLRDVVAVEENLEHLVIKSRMVHGTLDMVEPLISSICRLDIEAPSDVSGK